MSPPKSWVSSPLTPFCALSVCLACICALCVASATASVDRELDDTALFDFGTDLACELAQCVKGQCINTTAFPFYRCECNAGWAAPFGRSWLPCILPNCSIDYSCDNTTAATPPVTAPLVGANSNICSLPVCGNGECIGNSTGNSSTASYECKCDPGYVNLRNQSDGYCIRSCALGAGCNNIGLPIGGTSPSPPPPSSSSPGSSSGSGNQDLACELAQCVKGQCISTTAFPFYRCECNAGWAAPFGRSWLPCILPNCSIDFTCDNTTAATPPPVTAPLVGANSNICSLPVCGNGECIGNTTGNSSTASYECKCDPGYVNLRNQSDGYCIRSCSLSAGCSNVGLPFGGTSPSLPPPSSSSPGSSSGSGNQVDPKYSLRNNLIFAATAAAFVMACA